MYASWWTQGKKECRDGGGGHGALPPPWNNDRTMFFWSTNTNCTPEKKNRNYPMARGFRNRFSRFSHISKIPEKTETTRFYLMARTGVAKTRQGPPNMIKTCPKGAQTHSQIFFRKKFFGPEFEHFEVGESCEKRAENTHFRFLFSLGTCKSTTTLVAMVSWFFWTLVMMKNPKKKFKKNFRFFLVRPRQVQNWVFFQRILRVLAVISL